MKKYILLYSDKKPEDNICLTNMFKNNKKINLGWTDFDYNNNMKVINEEIEKIIKNPELMHKMEEKAISKSVKNVQDKIYKEIKKVVKAK